MPPAAVDPETSATTALDEATNKPPAGVVLPPKDIRVVVEKTAGYVARNGPVFEDRIRQKEINNPKFSFLAENDAYHAFYIWRLSEVRAGRGTTISAGRVGEEPARQAEKKPEGPEPPPEFRFSARMPNISALDLEVVRLTALFVAKNGRSWMTMLSQREAGKDQFAFLRPQHSLYQFFTRLIDQYTELLTGGIVDGGRPEKERKEQLEKNVKDRYHVLQRAKQRAEWVKYQEAQKAKMEEKEELEKRAYAEIDWHDFVVAETVLFTDDDERTELPPPTSLSDLQSASLEQKAMMSLAPANMRIEEAMPTEDMNMYNPQPPAAIQMPAPQFPQMPAPALPAGYPPALTAAQEEEERIRERAAERERAQQQQAHAQASARGPTGPVRIRENVPRAMARRRNDMAVCPHCKQQVPYDELEQHIKVELLDPQWREQKAKAESRFATTNLSTQDVAGNLKRLASQRTDVFDDVTGKPTSEEELVRRKRAAITSYDGTPEAAKAALGSAQGGMNLEEQIKAIHQKYGQ